MFVWPVNQLIYETHFRCISIFIELKKMKSHQIVLVSAIFLLTLINTCSALQTVIYNHYYTHKYENWFILEISFENSGKWKKRKCQST